MTTSERRFVKQGRLDWRKVRRSHRWHDSWLHERMGALRFATWRWVAGADRRHTTHSIHNMPSKCDNSQHRLRRAIEAWLGPEIMEWLRTGSSRPGLWMRRRDF